MTASINSSSFNGAKPDWQHVMRKYEQPNLLKAVWQLASTFIPYIILCVLMYFSYIADYSYWIILCLSILAAALLVRIFIFFHDCAHQSFFASRKANTVLGYICGVLTFTPYEEWRRSHGWHHNTFGDLDRRGKGDSGPGEELADGGGVREQLWDVIGELTQPLLLVRGGRSLVVDDLEDGFFLGPCLFDSVTRDMRIYNEEIFGPVLCIVRAESQEQAMQLIDDHEYGNGTCIFTRDGEAARYFADNIRVGMVGSLFGDLYAYGPDSVRFYTRRKPITQRWPSGGVREKAQFSFPGRQ